MKPEIKTAEQQKYYDYIINHINNVKKSFEEHGRKIASTLALSEYNYNLLKDYVEHHDESKFSEEEFEPYRQYFYNTPDEVPDKGKFDKAWIHHFTHNAHHPEYWLDKDGVPSPMSKVYIAEMVLDWEAMSRNFGGNPLNWYKGNMEHIILHSQTRALVEHVLIRTYRDDENLKFK